MEQVRNAKLDNACEGIADERATKNKADNEEKGLISGALQTMQKNNISVYRHAGVELARVPGAEKLRVRLTKETGDAGQADLIDDSEKEDVETGGEAGEVAEA